jgi:FixJ family two-component response regulator
MRESAWAPVALLSGRGDIPICRSDRKRRQDLTERRSDTGTIPGRVQTAIGSRERRRQNDGLSDKALPSLHGMTS